MHEVHRGTIEVLSNSFHRHCAQEYWKITSLPEITFAGIARELEMKRRFARLLYGNIEVVMNSRKIIPIRFT